MFGIQRAAGKVVLVADVDDMGVGVAIVETSREGPANVLASERMNLTLADRSPDHSIAAAMKLLEECAQKVMTEYQKEPKRKQPRDLYAIVRAPWTRFRSVFAEEQYEKPVTVSQKMLSSIAAKTLATNPEFQKQDILESGILRVYLNGYPTANPVGKHARIIAVDCYESDIVQEVRDGITAALTKIFPGRSVTIRSSLSAILGVLSDHLPDLYRYCIVDIGGSTTQCAVILKESVSRSVNVKEGMHTIIARIAGSGDYESVRSLLRMLATDTCSTDSCQALKDTLARSEPDLAKVFGESFAELAQKRRVPNAMILSAPADLTHWLSGFFMRLDFAPFTATLQPFSVELLSPEHIRDAALWHSGTPDTGLGIAAGYVNSLEHSA